MARPPRADSLTSSDERRLARWIDDLREIVIGGHVDVMSQVGEYLIEKVYGSEEEATSRRGNKMVSIERLSERAGDFGMTAAGLRRAVPIALQVRQLGRTLSTQLGVRHHRALLPVKDGAEKKVLAEAAVEAHWTAEELGKKVRRIHKTHAGGRSRQPGVRLFVERASRAVEGVDTATLHAGFEQVNAVERRRLLARVNAMQAVLERVEKQLSRSAGREKE